MSNKSQKKEAPKPKAEKKERSFRVKVTGLSLIGNRVAKGNDILTVKDLVEKNIQTLIDEGYIEELM